MAASFWAKGSKTVKSPESPTARTIDLPLPSPTPAEQNGTLSIPMADGSDKSFANDQAQNSPITANAIVKPVAKARLSAPKTNDWADEDADKAFYASFSAQSDPLQATVVTKEGRIGELEGRLSSLDKHIKALEETAKVNEGRLAQSVAMMVSQKGIITRLEKENTDQYLRVQELVAEVDEKDRRITALEVDLDKKGAMIQELEAVSSTIPKPKESDSNSSSYYEDEEAPTEDAKSDGRAKVGKAQNGPGHNSEHASHADLTSSSGSASESASTAPAKNNLEPVAKPPLASSGPTVNDLEFPVFSTPETLKAAPLPPMPKKLVFPNAQFFNKLGQKTVTSKSSGAHSKDDNLAAAPGSKLVGQNHKKSEAVPTIDLSKGIRKMDRAQRMLFGNGPEIEVKMGSTVFAKLPKYVLM